MDEAEKNLIEKLKKEREQWCEHECPDRFNSECWTDCQWFSDNETE